uniref:Uncharacterized protein n=1 Tax=Spongospora subterranea TaxID=70186 RepID=A0A0H5QL50_9EUKA|eukprot:CRZ02743.1 hypothetical protein [Spongospora subterranea]
MGSFLEHVDCISGPILWRQFSLVLPTTPYAADQIPSADAITDRERVRGPVRDHIIDDVCRAPRIDLHQDRRPADVPVGDVRHVRVDRGRDHDRLQPHHRAAAPVQQSIATRVQADRPLHPHLQDRAEPAVLGRFPHL